MFEGNTKAAIRLLTGKFKGRCIILRLGDHIDKDHTVRDVLIEKHLPAQPASPDSIYRDDPPKIQPIYYRIMGKFGGSFTIWRISPLIDKLKTAKLKFS